jgi:glycosyltransferase involved in cell wall biosynthesis
MNDKKISIIIKSNCALTAISSLLRQNNNNWECLLVNNSVENIEQYIINDARFKIFNIDNDLNTIYEAIKRSTGQYIMFIDSNDILLNDAINHILHMIEFTDADIIKYKSLLLSESLPEFSDRKCIFKYIFNKETILDYAFNNISEFCFKKNIVSGTDSIKSLSSVLTDALSKSKDMTLTKQTLLIKQTCSNITVDDTIDNYKNNHDKIAEKFWLKYFKDITPAIISGTVKANDKQSFIKFCNNIPLHLIPLRYRIICYILKKTNK